MKWYMDKRFWKRLGLKNQFTHSWMHRVRMKPFEKQR